MNTSITLGTNFYQASGDEMRRQRAAQDSWRALPGVDLVDLQFARDPARLDLPGFRRVEKLRHDSIRLTGRPGKRKPVASEVFDLLAREAVASGHELFAFSNADIILTPEMLATTLAAAAAGCKAQVFSRMDFDPATGADIGMVFQGQDTYVLDARWWLENRWRFRPYIVGELCWDDAFTSILLCHAPGARLYNRTGYIRHELHLSDWYDSPFRGHNKLMLALDAPYFTVWSHYCDRLGQLRDAEAGEAQEVALMEESFDLAVTGRDRLKNLAGVARAAGRQWLQNAARGRFGVPPHRSVYH